MAPSVRVGIGQWNLDVDIDGTRVDIPILLRDRAEGRRPPISNEAPWRRRANYRPNSSLTVRISRAGGVIGPHLGLLTLPTGDTYPRLADG
jgi:hypothetical protein